MRVMPDELDWNQYVNPTSADSDRESLGDGWEFNYRNVTHGFGDEEKVRNHTATYDVDGDGISDGQEYIEETVSCFGRKQEQRECRWEVSLMSRSSIVSTEDWSWKGSQKDPLRRP